MCVASHHGTIVLYHAPVLGRDTVHGDYGCFTVGIPGRDHRVLVPTMCVFSLHPPLGLASVPGVLHLLWLCSLAVWEIRSVGVGGDLAPRSVLSV